MRNSVAAICGEALSDPITVDCDGSGVVSEYTVGPNGCRGELVRCFAPIDRVKVYAFSGTEPRVNPSYALIEVALVVGLRPTQALVGLLNCRGQGLEELGALVPLSEGDASPSARRSENYGGGLLSTSSNGVVPVVRCTWKL